MKMLHSSGLESGGSASADEAAAKVDFSFHGKLPADALLQWNLNRWHDTSIGEWISEDPIGYAGDDTNLRPYVGTKTDPA